MLAETLEAAGAIPRSHDPHMQVAELPAGEQLDIVAYIEPAGRKEPRTAAEPVTIVGRDAEGRLVRAEVAANSIVTVGPRTSIAEARDLALKVLDGNAKAIAAPDTLFKLALAFVGVGVTAARQVDRERETPEGCVP